MPAARPSVRLPTFVMAQQTLRKRPVALILLSGLGWSHVEAGNAAALARTPFLDDYFSKYPHTRLEAAGEFVGLPAYQPGNSEVSHLIIGSGQTAPLDINRIDEAIRNGKFFENPTLTAAVDAGRRTALHLIGLVSDGGVHSMDTHLHALLQMAAERGVERVYVHAFTDGRDTPPTSGRDHLQDLTNRLRRMGVGEIATICGRYYAMDRDDRWDRIKLAYDALTQGAGARAADPVAAIERCYEQGITDEFIRPIVLTRDDGAPVATIQNGDSVIFFNFRADRARQLTRAFTGLNFDQFERTRLPDLHFATFTQYDRSVTSPIVFPPIEIHDTLAEIFARHGLRNLRIAETEKYAHVTYFFNGGIEREFPGESRILVPSPRVATYDQRPEMSAFRVTDKLLRALDVEAERCTILRVERAAQLRVLWVAPHGVADVAPHGVDRDPGVISRHRDPPPHLCRSPATECFVNSYLHGPPIDALCGQNRHALSVGVARMRSFGFVISSPRAFHFFASRFTSPIL